MVGPTASGKSTYAKMLAKKFNLFHFDFHTRLQELVISKTRLHVGSKYFEERELNRQKSINIQKVINELVTENTDFRDLSSSLSQISKELQDAGENGADQDVVELIKTQKADESGLGEPANVPEPPVMDEFLEGIVAYLESDASLQDFHLEPILSELWNNDPYKTNGFIIEGFPKNQSDVSYLEENGLLPDLCIILQSNQNECVARQLEKQVNLFKSRRKLAVELKESMKAKRQELREKKVADRKKQIETKMAEIEAKKQAKQAAKERRLAAKIAAGEDPEEDEEEDVEESEEEELDFEPDADVQFNLEREFSDWFNENLEDDGLLGFEELETVDDAFDRIKGELEVYYEESSQAAGAVTESCEDYNIPKIIFDISNQRKDSVKNKLFKGISSILPPTRAALCESVYPVSLDQADQMLATGFAKLSPYGKFDPILMDSEQADLAEWHKTKEGENKKFPCLYNGELFYFDKPDNRLIFKKNPLNFIRQETNNLSLPLKIPVRLAIVGPPKSGKTTLAQRFADEQNLLKISIGEACRRILSFYPSSSLARRMNQILLTGETISPELEIEAVQHWLLNERTKTQGYVFDGFPNSLQHVGLLRNSGILPYTIIDLDCELEESVTRAVMAKLNRQELALSHPNNHEPIHHDSPKIIELKYAHWAQVKPDLQAHYQIGYSNYHIFPAKQNRWKLWTDVKKCVFDTLHSVQTYVQQQKLNQAAAVKNLAIHYQEILDNLDPKFGCLCPVSLKVKGEIFDSAENFADNQFTAKYKNYFYKLADQEKLDLFLSNPDVYLDLEAENIPTDMVKIIVLENSEDVVENPVFNKFCPVTRILTGELKYGNPRIGAEYKGANYIFVDEKLRDEFVKKPEIYYEGNNVLPVKIPPIPEIGEQITPISQLPNLGYLGSDG